MKQCKRCNQLKTLESFCKHKRQKDGLSDWCRHCCSVYNKEFYKSDTNKKKRKNKNLKWWYGISLEDYNYILNHQNNRCAICKKLPEPYKSLYVDHNHTTNKVRGLLCSNCNTALGFLKED